MADLTIRDDVAQRLREIAQREKRSVEEVLNEMIERYGDTGHAPESASSDPIEAFIGAFDNDISDLSTTVRETMQTYYRRKYGRTD